MCLHIILFSTASNFVKVEPFFSISMSDTITYFLAINEDVSVITKMRFQSVFFAQVKVAHNFVE